MTLFGQESISKCSANRNWVITCALGGRLRPLTDSPKPLSHASSQGEQASFSLPVGRMWAQSVQCRAERKPSQLGLARSSDLWNWEQINGYRFKPLKISWLLCLSVFLWTMIRTWADEQGSVQWKKTRLEGNFQDRNRVFIWSGQIKQWVTAVSLGIIVAQ